MKIKNNGAEFKIDGVKIRSGVGNYPVDYKNPKNAYMLGILKREGVIDFNEIVKFGELPVEPVKVEKNDDVKKPKRTVKKVRRNKAGSLRKGDIPK